MAVGWWRGHTLLVVLACAAALADVPAPRAGSKGVGVADDAALADVWPDDADLELFMMSEQALEGVRAMISAAAASNEGSDSVLADYFVAKLQEVMQDQDAESSPDVLPAGEAASPVRDSDPPSSHTSRAAQKSTASSSAQRGFYVVGGKNATHTLRAVDKVTVGALNNSGAPAVQWLSVPRPLLPRYGSAAVRIDNVVVVIGGHSGTEYLRSVEKYDSARLAWSPQASMGTARFAPAASILDHHVFVAGGYNPQAGYLASAEAYSLSLNVWRALASMAAPRRGLALVNLQGFLYAMGGSGGAGALATVERYDPDMDLWAPATPMLYPRDGLAGVALRGAIYAVGGYNQQLGHLNKVERLDGTLGSWIEVASLNAARDMAAAVAYNGSVYVFGGYNADDGVLASIEAFRPGRDWAVVATMAGPREGAAVVVL